MALTKVEPQVKVVDSPEKEISTLREIVINLEAVQPETRYRIFGFLKSKYRNDWPTNDY